MPYKRNYKRKRVLKRRRGGRARFMRVGSKVGSVAYSAYRLARRLKDAVNTEYKFFDTQSTTTPDYNGSIIALNAITQGQTDNTRIGDSCKLQNLILRGHLAAAAGAAAVIRMIVYWDQQNKSSAASDILQYTGSVYGVYSPKQYDKRFQTTVLMDKVISSVPTADSSLYRFDEVIPINRHTQFDGGTTTVNTGALKMLLISSNVTTNLPSVVFLSRVSYTDN